jgi:hypothetical protein
MASTLSRGHQSSSAPVDPRRDRLFYGGMGLAMGLTVLAGFAPTYYLTFLEGGPATTVTGRPFTWLVHVHGALFTAWMLFFVAQTSLVAGRRVTVHRRLGMAGAALAAAMTLAGVSMAVDAASQGAAPPGMEPLAFLAIPFFDMVLFALFVTAAIVRRRDFEAHKRLMLLAYTSIVVAGVARLPGVLAGGPMAFYGLTLIFIAAGLAYDVATRRRVHRVYVWGGLLFVLSVPARLAISGTGAWRSFAEILTR